MSFRPLDWITDTLAVGSFEGPFPDDAAVIDVRQIPDHCYILPRAFEAVMATISAGIESRGRVVIHCTAGMRRSPTFAAVWLCLRSGMTLCDALATIKRKRPMIDPHPEQLRAADDYIKSHRAYPIQEPG